MKMENKIEAIVLDTCTIYGEGGKRAKSMKQIEKPFKKQKEIKDGGILYKLRDSTKARFTTVITPYEFIKELSRDEGISIDQARRIYSEIIGEFGILEIIPRPKEINLSHTLMNKICDCGLDLADGLQIYITSLRKLPFVTSENKKLPNMKKFYSGVMHVKEIIKG